MHHTVYLFDGFQLDVTRRKLISSGGLVQPLNSRAMDALLLLLENAGELVEKRRLMQTVWPNAIVEENNLNQCVLAIRKALGEAAGSNRFIMTVPGRGYRFVSPVHVVQQESSADTTSVSVLRRRSVPFMWLGIAVFVCLSPLVFLLLRIAHEAGDPVQATIELTTTPSRSSQEIVLRLHDPTGMLNGATAQSTAALFQCLAAQTDMKLRVRVQLVEEDGGLVWSGNYSAGALEPLELRPVAQGEKPDCRELMAAVRLEHMAAPAHQD